MESTKMNKTDQAYEQIKDNLVWNVYPAGTFLQERQLSEELGISRTPIRSAMSRLVSEGLLQQIPNRGIYVPEITLTDVIEIYDLRMVNDGLAASYFAQQATAAQLEKLKTILDTAEKSIADGDYKQWRACDWQFHETYIESISNTRLKSFLLNLSEQSKMIYIEQMDTSVCSEKLCAYRAVWDAFSAHDAQLAEQLIRLHWIDIKNLAIERYLHPHRSGSV